MAREVHQPVGFPTPNRHPATDDYRWDERQQRAIPIAVDTPPPPVDVATNNHYVPYETTDYRNAHAWASAQVARKFPGAVEVLTTLDSLIQQQLNAK